MNSSVATAASEVTSVATAVTPEENTPEPNAEGGLRRQIRRIERRRFRTLAV